jgi:ABC-type sulfate transport system permease component
MQINTEAHNSFHKSTLIFGIIVCFFALLIAGLGIWLITLKSSGKTEFELFGQKFFSENVGVSAIFIGAVILILAVRRILKSLDKISDNYSKTTHDILNSGSSKNTALEAAAPDDEFDDSKIMM